MDDCENTGDEDPETEAEWLVQQRTHVMDYLDAEKVNHGGVSDSPAWYVTPYVSLWKIGSALAPGKTSWWAICGDLPTDYITAGDAANARDVIRAFGERWMNVSAYMRKGKPHPTITIGAPEDRVQLGDLLRIRGEALLGWSNDYDIEL